MHRVLFSFLWTAMLCGLAGAQGGHGPVFGYATPTNSQGEWSFDAGVLGRNASDTTQVTLRSMVGYGFTPHLTMWVVAPVILNGASFQSTSMGGGGDFESKFAWRFHRNAKGVGTRFETTAAMGVVVQGPQTGSGIMSQLRRAPGLDLTLASGIASRAHYFWLGGGYRGFLEREGDRRADSISYSAVYGYRPPSWRTEMDKWDWRVFGEMTGERSGTIKHGGMDLAGSPTHRIFLGPSVLGIYQKYAIQAGVQLPVYQSSSPIFPKERIRFAVNFSYFLFQGSHH